MASAIAIKVKVYDYFIIEVFYYMFAIKLKINKELLSIPIFCDKE
jgi:hypothetical protein